MIDWLVAVLRFEYLISVDGEDGGIAHAEPVVGGGVIMIGSSTGTRSGPHGIPQASAIELERANTRTLQIYVDDVDAHYQRAENAVAAITDERFLSDHGADYWADRSYGALEPEGHLRWIVERTRG